MSERKNILFLCSWYPNEQNPALGNFIKRHAEAVSLYADVTVLAAFSDEKLNYPEVKISESENLKEVLVYYPKSRLPIPLLKDLAAYKTYMSAMTKGIEKLKAFDFDLVHIHVAFPAGLFALELKRKYKLEYVISEHWTGYLSIKDEFNKLSKLKKWQYKKIFSESSKVTTVSQDLGEAIKNRNLTERFEVIPNVVDNSLFFPIETNKNEVPTFIHVSTFDDKHKNISGMFQAFQKLAEEGYNYKLRLVSEKGKEIVNELLTDFKIPKKNLEIYGRQTPEDVAQLIKTSNCFVLFSNYETFSVVLAESWACGIPCIYSKCGGLTEVDDKKLGVQIKTNDILALFQALKDFTIDKEIYSKKDISLVAQKFYKEAVGSAFCNFYLTLS